MRKGRAVPISHWRASGQTVSSLDADPPPLLLLLLPADAFHQWL